MLSEGLSQPLSCLILLRTLKVYRAALYYPDATNETKHPRSGNQLELTPLFLSVALRSFLNGKRVYLVATVHDEQNPLNVLAAKSAAPGNSGR